MPIAMISGHLDLTWPEFNQHYVPLIDEAIAAGHHFVIGDAPGADAMAQGYLARHKRHESHVTVYYAGGYPRNDFPTFNRSGGYSSYTAKDEAMTESSDYDIAWVRPGEEYSGTARNLARRLPRMKGN